MSTTFYRRPWGANRQLRSMVHMLAEAIAVTLSGSRDEPKLRRGSLPAVTHSCGSFSLRRATAAALRSVSDNRFGAGAGGAGECEACFAFGFDPGGGICPGVTTPAGSPLRSMRTAPGLSASRYATSLV